MTDRNNTPMAYILILNWNGWKDTIDCLNSVLAIKGVSFRVVVCDNCSMDGSIEKIRDWANDQSLSLFETTDEQIESGPFEIREEWKLSLIKIKENRGFAGGNNVGLRLIQMLEDYQYVWLLNNDTCVDPSALYHLISRIGEKSGAGLCGSAIYYYDNPNVLQAMGGASYNKWISYSKHICAYKTDPNELPIEIVENKMDYVVGASMLVTKPFLDRVGLLCEEYFLYFEELDWAIRGKVKGFSLACAPNSIVWHKEGASIGSSSTGSMKSELADYYGTRNKLLFTKKFYPEALPTVYLGLFLSVMLRIKRGQWGRAVTILKLMVGVEEQK